MPFVSGHKHDLFLSYAHKEAAWVEAFGKALGDEFQERTGKQITFWQDSQNLRLGQKWGDEIKEGIRNAAAFVAIVSPTYFNSPWCVQERSIVLEKDLEALKVDSFYRFLKIVKTPGPGKLHEEMLKELQDIRFFNKADNYELLAGSPEYTCVIRQAVRHIWELLRFMSNKGREVYIAPGAIEMHGAREEVERELKDKGFTIKPEVLLDITFGKDPIREAMDKVSLTLFLLGGVFDNFTARQIEVAQELGKPVAFWVQPLGPTSEMRKDILERINELRPPDSEVLGGRSISELIPQLLAKLKPKEAPETAPASGVARVYLNYDNTLPDDSRIAAGIGDMVRARKFELLQNGRDGDHDRLMRTSNAVLLFRAVKPDPDWWLKYNAMELAFAGQIENKALLVTDPARVRTLAPGVPVYSYSEPFAPETLEPFFDRLRRAHPIDARQ